MLVYTNIHNQRHTTCLSIHKHPADIRFIKIQDVPSFKCIISKSFFLELRRQKTTTTSDFLNKHLFSVNIVHYCISSSVCECVAQNAWQIGILNRILMNNRSNVIEWLEIRLFFVFPLSLCVALLISSSATLLSQSFFSNEFDDTEIVIDNNNNNQ